MSAASEPAPRVGFNPASRHSLFLPMLVFVISYAIYSFYRVLAAEDQLDLTVRYIDRLDAQVKLAEFEKEKLHSVARAVLALAPKDPNAEQIVVEFKLHQLIPATQEMLPGDAPISGTNSAPKAPASQLATPPASSK